MAEAVGSLFNLIGPPIAGLLTGMTKDGTRGYLGVQLFAGIGFFTGVALLFLLWYLIVLTDRKSHRDGD
jgi:hypothetical protein